jgi:cell migration-inducing and hyaluronan-binding protein
MVNATRCRSLGAGLRPRRAWLLFGVILGFALAGFSRQSEAFTCSGGLSDTTRIGAPPEDMLVDSLCEVTGTSIKLGQVNIVKGGKLVFIEPASADTATGQDFWASSIIIENGGEMLAGVNYTRLNTTTNREEIVEAKPYGTNEKTLRIHLYGKDPGMGAMGALCKSTPDIMPWAEYTDCGIPRKIDGTDMWASNGTTDVTLPASTQQLAYKDRFYKYGSLHGDKQPDDAQNMGHFGNKVLALSYGGTLRLRGKKGTSGTSEVKGDDGKITDQIPTLLKNPDTLKAGDAKVITSSGTDWIRLADGKKFPGNGEQRKDLLTLDLPVSNDWKVGDEVVVTTTDYFPDHSELRTIAAFDKNNSSVIKLNKPLTYDHNSTAYNIETKVGSKSTPTAFRTAIEKVDGPDPAFLKTAETRAAVALLTRSIRIMSEGDDAGDTFADATNGRQQVNPQDPPAIPPNPSYSYGAQAVFRQGFKQLQIQGVEFAQMGQGGRLGRYPIHFHLARRVPADTYVIDSSINESMTRWIVLHSTLGVTLARNVGYKSIGHGFFLEDGTETDNKLYSNIGIFARAGVTDKTVGEGPNPRNIPGILDAKNFPESLPLKYHSDAQYPSVFWIVNGWNSIAGNMAAGAGTCGACYWIPSVANHDFIDVQAKDGTTPMEWSGYSAIQEKTRAGRSPIKLFYQNYCTTAMHSLNISDGSPCTLVTSDTIHAIGNPMAPPSPDANRKPDAEPESPEAIAFYPRYSGQRAPTVCNPGVAKDSANGGCTRVDCDYGKPEWCAVSTFSHYTTSFNWAEANFSAIWLRGGWLMFDHGFMSDVLGAGITEVSGGDYARANLPIGYWALTSNSIFVGQTQPNNKYAAVTLPVGCSRDGGDRLCVNTAASTAYLRGTANWLIGQRLYNIYDGPAYQDANAYLDVKVTPCTSIETCYVWETVGLRRAASDYKVPVLKKGDAYVPNAAIGWKQPNGFYYPPAFHSRSLLFRDVDIRHYVIEPLTEPGTYKTDFEQYKKDYAQQQGLNDGFNNYTDVDRQTELSDDDGTMTGFERTISVNEDPYFGAPVQAPQCKSNLTVDPKYACAPQPKNDARISVPTARTSPYDHITTAIYPACAVAKTEGEALRDCDDAKAKDAPWGRDCTNPLCYGVPIYRQLLTKGDATNPRERDKWTKETCNSLIDKLKPPAGTPAYKAAVKLINDSCRFPFIRMAGVNGWQRSVMTANNGTYYIDTTVSKETQLASKDLNAPPGDRRINVFAAGQTYYVFFLFAKKDTKQTYQIYVGADAKDADVKGVKISPMGWPIDQPQIQGWAMPWKPEPIKDGLLTLTVDFNEIPDEDINPANTKKGASVESETCKPVSYCRRNETSNACECNTEKLSVLGLLYPDSQKVCQTTCRDWAVKDLDCPKGGCLGFSFKMGAGFKAQDQYQRPKPESFPTTKEGDPWKTILFEGSKDAGDCTYTAAQTPKIAGNPKCDPLN